MDQPLSHSTCGENNTNESASAFSLVSDTVNVKYTEFWQFSHESHTFLAERSHTSLRLAEVVAKLMQKPHKICGGGKEEDGGSMEALEELFEAGEPQLCIFG